MSKIVSLPNSLEIEVQILGSMLKDTEELNLCLERLNVTDFFSPSHQLIFAACQTLYHEDQAVNLNTLINELKRCNELEKSGGVTYLAQVKSCVSLSDDLESCVGILKEKSRLRSIMSLGQDMIDTASKEEKSANLIESAEKRLFLLQGNLSRNTIYTIKEVQDGRCDRESVSILERVIEASEMAKKGSVVIGGLPTHYLDLDKMISGFSGGQFVIFGARPGVGKTSLMANIVLNMIERGDPCIGIFTLEVQAEEMVKKLLFAHAEINTQFHLKGGLLPKEIQALENSSKLLASKKIHIDDQSALTLPQLRSRARRWREVNNVNIIFIDYLQLMRSGSKTESKQYEVSEISQAIKSLAKDLDIPIVCLAQLNRKSEDRESKTPALSDLRESGSLEQDTDVVVLLHAKEKTPGLLTLLVCKNRFGSTGEVELTFSKEKGRIKNHFRQEIVDRQRDFDL